MTEDSIKLSDLIFFGYHGIKESERSLGQRFIVDIVIKKDLKKSSSTDNLSDTVDYRVLHKIARDIVEGPSKKLIETVADEIAQQILLVIVVDSVQVTITKPSAEINQNVTGNVSVTIVRNTGN
jgi:dihydroneopterin aldolase